MSIWRLISSQNGMSVQVPANVRKPPKGNMRCIVTMLKRLSLTVAILIVANASAQPAPMDLLAEDIGFRLDWDAYARTWNRS